MYWIYNLYTRAKPRLASTRETEADFVPYHVEVLRLKCHVTHRRSRVHLTRVMWFCHGCFRIWDCGATVQLFVPDTIQGQRTMGRQTAVIGATSWVFDRMLAASNICWKHALSRRSSVQVSTPGKPSWIAPRLVGGSAHISISLWDMIWYDLIIWESDMICHVNYGLRFQWQMNWYGWWSVAG